MAARIGELHCIIMPRQGGKTRELAFQLRQQRERGHTVAAIVTSERAGNTLNSRFSTPIGIVLMPDVQWEEKLHDLNATVVGVDDADMWEMMNWGTVMKFWNDHVKICYLTGGPLLIEKFGCAKE